MRPTLLAIVAAVVALGSSRPARGYCRATTSKLLPDEDPSVTGTCTVSGAPLFWRSACVGWDVQAGASVQAPYTDAVAAVTAAFSAWTASPCGAGEGAQGAGPSITFVNLGPVLCDEVQYSSCGTNQNVVVFHDDTWPYDDATNALGLTTISFDADNGEILDADIEINATEPLSLASPPAAGAYDLHAILRHEAGHFLGLAHSVTPEAEMYAFYPFPVTLSRDDLDGVCAIYPPGGERRVAPSAADGGRLASGGCNPSPTGGWSSSCTTPCAGAGCQAARVGSPDDPHGVVGIVGPGVLCLLFAAGTMRVARGRRTAWSRARLTRVFREWTGAD